MIKSSPPHDKNFLPHCQSFHSLSFKKTPTGLELRISYKKIISRYTLDAFKSFIKLLTSEKNILFLAHKDPDYDTVSACQALALIAQSFGCNVEITVPNTEPIIVEHFSIPIQSATYKNKPDSTKRIFYPEELHNIPLALFDHHQGGDISSTYTFVETTAPSCCDVIAHLITEYDRRLLTQEIAQMLLDGIVSDTLFFRTSAVAAKTLTRTAILLECGAQPIISHNRLVQKQTPQNFMFKTHLMARMQVDENASCAYLIVTEKELVAAGKDRNILEGVGNEMLAGMFIETTVILFELLDGTTKGSMRSYTKNVYELARSRGGGGHIAAAGFTSTETPDAILKSLLSELKK